jgi:hypothetical protein
MTTLIGFSTPRKFNPVSWLVKVFTGSKASHAFFVYLDTDFDMEMVMEAHELGFRLTPFEHFKTRNKLVGLYKPIKPIDVGMKYVAKRYLGTAYDFKGLFGGIIVQLGRWLKRKWRNPMRGAKNVVCSEAIVISMQMSPGYEEFKDDPDSVDPQLLMKYCDEGYAEKVAT